MSGPQRCGTPQISSNKEGTKWTGKCWYVHNLLKYEFDLQFDIPVRLPANTPLACHGQNVLVPLFLCWRRRQMGWSLVGWVVCSSRLVQPLLVLSIFTAPCQTLTVRFATLFAFDQAQVTYPATAPELELPELDGKTSKMFRGGKICLTIHFKPLWSKNVPHFGIAHALCLGLGPWMVRSVTRQAEKEKERKRREGGGRRREPRVSVEASPGALPVKGSTCHRSKGLLAPWHASLRECDCSCGPGTSLRIARTVCLDGALRCRVMREGDARPVQGGGSGGLVGARRRIISHRTKAPPRP
jgi:hypothetical protein